ncbi:MAG: class I SAM-dependent methyltransferase [Candidatus Aminicenantes bacterium]|nr:class I SAM-dependent methyltransferase [Candidatus Aminicenantes bacterium]
MICQRISHWNFRRKEECRTLIRWLDPRPRERILDIGCGDGYYDALIAKSGAYVVGIDVHPERLAIAGSRNKNDRTAYLSMDAERMGFEEASFDKAISLCAMEHLRNDQRVMEHVFRVLKPGGTFVFSADSLSNPGLPSLEHIRHKERYEVNNYYRIETIRPKLEAIGFELRKIRYILTTPLTLSLVRFSWRLERLPRALKFIYLAGCLGVNTIGKIVSDISEHFAGRPESGLTLLVTAKKPLPRPK